MFRLRPKNKAYLSLSYPFAFGSSDEITCCRADLGGRTETEILYRSSVPPIVESEPVNNGDGTWTTEWTSVPHTDSVYNGGGVLGFTICCGEYLRIDWADTTDDYYDNSTDFEFVSLHDKSVTDPDAYGKEEHYYAFPPDADAGLPPSGSRLIHEEWTTRQPPYSFDLYPESAFPITACGMTVCIGWEGGVTFSITHGKDPT
jgi:hypothetical protein